MEEYTKFVRCLKQKNYYQYYRILNNRGLFKILFSILKEPEVYIEFIDYIDLSYAKYYTDNSHHMCKTKMEYISNVKPSLLLVNAFNWSYSKHGDAFWRGLNAAYRTKLGYAPSTWSVDDDDVHLRSTNYFGF